MTKILTPTDRDELKRLADTTAIPSGVFEYHPQTRRPGGVTVSQCQEFYRTLGLPEELKLPVFLSSKEWGELWRDLMTNYRSVTHGLEDKLNRVQQVQIGNVFWVNSGTDDRQVVDGANELSRQDMQQRMHAIRARLGQEEADETESIIQEATEVLEKRERDQKS